MSKPECFFPVMGGTIEAVRNLDMRILGRQGHGDWWVSSGSGKSFSVVPIMGIETPVARTSGRIVFKRSERDEPLDLLALPHDGRKIRSIRGNRIRHDLPGADDLIFADAHHRQPD